MREKLISEASIIIGTKVMTWQRSTETPTIANDAVV
jgi:hypothetical protein